MSQETLPAGPLLVEFDPLTPEFRADPYRVYARLREAPGLTYWEYGQMWLAARYSDVHTVLTDPRFRCEAPPEVTERFLAVAPASLVPLYRTVLFTDPPYQARLRAYLGRTFHPRQIAHLAARARRVIDDVLDRALEQGSFEVIDELAYPLPVTIICDVLGLPAHDLPLFREWADTLSRLADIPLHADRIEPAARAAEEFYEYLGDLVAQRRARPGQDAISTMLQTEVDGQRITTEELLAMTVLLLASGHEAIVGMIGNAMYLLLSHPDQLARLRREPSLAESALEEILRYESPLQVATAGGRWATEEITFGDTVVQPGQRVLSLLGAANRDPEAFAEPDQFDVARPRGRTVAFGLGVHFCLGAALARMEGHALLEALIERPLDLELIDTEPQWRDSFILRGPDRLRVAVRAARR